MTVLTLLALAALCGWLRAGVSTLPSMPVAMAPVTEGAFMGLLLFFSVAVIVLAVRKVRDDAAFYAGLREADREGEDWLRVEEGTRQSGEKMFMVGPLESLSEPMAEGTRESPAPWGGRAEDEDVFAGLREPGGRVDAEDARRILVACAAEARCVAKHVSRALMTLSVDDYGDELELAGRKLEGVIRCVEALVERMSEEEDAA